MARQPGTKAEDNATDSGLSGAVARGLGFIVLAALAMAIYAALVLMPAWARAVRVEHQRDVSRARIDRVEKIVAAGARGNIAVKHDPVLVERYARGMVTEDPLHAAPLEPIAKPSGPMLEIADKLAQQKTRRGLFLVACAALAGAMFLFAPPPIRGNRI